VVGREGSEASWDVGDCVEGGPRWGWAAWKSASFWACTCVCDCDEGADAGADRMGIEVGVGCGGSALLSGDRPEDDHNQPIVVVYWCLFLKALRLEPVRCVRWGGCAVIINFCTLLPSRGDREWSGRRGVNACDTASRRLWKLDPGGR
jgi:hypothetical protein